MRVRLCGVPKRAAALWLALCGSLGAMAGPAGPAPSCGSLEALEGGFAPSAWTARALELRPDDQRHVLPDGSSVTYGTARGTAERIDPTDLDADGLPDAVAAASRGLDACGAILVGELGLPAVPAIAVVLGWLPGEHDGLVASSPDGPAGRWVVALDARPGTPASTVVRGAAHQLTHVALATSGRPLSAAWSEAFASWVELRAAGAEGPMLDRLRYHRDRLHEGLVPDDRGAASGNALWLAFLAEAYGTSTLRAGLEELANSHGDDLAAWDRALRRSTGSGLSDAIRELQVWSTLTGTRDDGRHWSFATPLGDPEFSHGSEWLPALSVRSDPPVARFGLASARIRPDGVSGGLTVRFEGDFGGAWGADVLLTFRDGALHRVPLVVDAVGSGEVTVPLDRVIDAVLLVRNLSADGPPRRFTWSAFREPGFPVEFDDLNVAALPDASGVAVSWTTSSERRVVGFEVWRESAGGGRRVRVSPVRVPAIGAPGQPTSYRFVDRGAAAGRPYVYSIEAVTVEGLGSSTNPSAPIVLPPG